MLPNSKCAIILAHVKNSLTANISCQSNNGVVYSAYVCIKFFIIFHMPPLYHKFHWKVHQWHISWQTMFTPWHISCVQKTQHLHSMCKHVSETFKLKPFVRYLHTSNLAYVSGLLSLPLHKFKMDLSLAFGRNSSTSKQTDFITILFILTFSALCNKLTWYHCTDRPKLSTIEDVINH